MKVLVALLVCSLVANAAFFFRSREASDPNAAAHAAPRETGALAEARRADAERLAVATLFDSAKTDGATLKARLDAMGFPPEIVRAAIREQLRHDNQTKQRAAVGNVEPKPFWETGTAPFGLAGGDAETEKTLNSLRRELRAQTIELLGTELEISDTAMAVYQQRWGPLPVEKIQTIQRIENDYAELQRELMSGRSSSTLSPTEQEKYALLQREQRADLVAALTPDELFEYDLRRSTTASRLRSQVQVFDASEEEYRAIFKVQYALDQASGRDVGTMGITYVLGNARTEERAALMNQLKDVLSPERYNDFEFATNPSNTNLVRITTRLGLPMDAARDVVAARAETMQAIAGVRGNTGLSTAERTAEVAAIARATNERVTRTLGAEGHQAYIEHGGSWLASLSPAPSRPAAPTP